MAAKFTNLEGKDYVDPEIITEDIEHSWYSYPQAGKALHPFAGVTAPNYTGPKEGTKTNWKYLDEKGKYSWDQDAAVARQDGRGRTFWPAIS